MQCGRGDYNLGSGGGDLIGLDLALSPAFVPSSVTWPTGLLRRRSSSFSPGLGSSRRSSGRRFHQDPGLFHNPSHANKVAGVVEGVGTGVEGWVKSDPLLWRKRTILWTMLSSGTGGRRPNQEGLSHLWAVKPWPHSPEDLLHIEFFRLLPDPVGQEAAGLLVANEETVVGDVVAVTGRVQLSPAVEDLGGGDDGEGKNSWG